MTTATRRLFLLCLAASLLVCLASAQSPIASQSSAAVVPRLVNFSGKAIDGGKLIMGVAGATFAIYSEESGGSPLWMETQNITLMLREITRFNWEPPSHKVFRSICSARVRHAGWECA